MAQRYDIWIYHDTMETDKDDNGDWVKYDDHTAEITQLRAEISECEAALEEIATYDTGATAGLAYTAQQALDTRRNK